MSVGTNNPTSCKKIVGERLEAARRKTARSRQKAVDDLNDCPLAPSSHRLLQLDTYKKWEYGTNPIDIEWIPAICETYKCGAGFLFGEYDEPSMDVHKIREKIGLEVDAIEHLQKIKAHAKTEMRYGQEGILAGNIHKQEVLNFLISRDDDFDLLRSLYSLLFSKGSMFAMDRQTEAGSKERLSGRMVAVCNNDPDIIETAISVDDIQSVFMLTVQKTLLNMRDTIQNQNQPTNVKRKRPTSRQRD